jgi:hypothetical protein
MPTPLTGGCLCGAVRYSISVPVTDLRACHCRNCQKSSGSTGGVNAVVPAEAFKITQGTTKHYEDSATESGRTLSRHFCGHCGSPVYSHRNPPPGFIVVRAGTFDDKQGMKITANIWTASACPWAYIDPATQSLPGNPPMPAPTRP